VAVASLPQCDSSIESQARLDRESSFTSLRALREVVRRHWTLALAAVAGALLLCTFYCLLAPRQYEATARVALRTSPEDSLGMETGVSYAAASILSAPLQQETAASALRGDGLAWRVIADLNLYRAPGFGGNFDRRFPGFRVDAPSSQAQAWLLKRFGDRLHVQTVPHTLLIQIRFRSRDAKLSADVVNALIRIHSLQETEERIRATERASASLAVQLQELQRQAEADDLRLAAFQRRKEILSAINLSSSGHEGETDPSPISVEIDELSRQVAVATAERIQRENAFRAASQGNPETEIAADLPLQGEAGAVASAQFRQIRARRGALEEEQAQLAIEHGPSFPRVVEIRGQLSDLDRQKAAADAEAMAVLQVAWQTAVERERMVKESLAERTAEGARRSQAESQYAAMRQEANSSRELYIQMKRRVEEAGLVAGIHNSSLAVVDAALAPAHPVRPNPPVDFAIAFFAGLWLAVGAAAIAESLHPAAGRTLLTLAAMLLAGSVGRAQAPTPNTSGLPTGVVRTPLSEERRSRPNPKDAPPVWGISPSPVAVQSAALPVAGLPMAALIGPGDSLEIAEFHTPEFHTAVRVGSTGSVTLPMIGEIRLAGLDEQGAARAIEAALQAQGMLLHPKASVLVTAYAGADVSVLGEVVRPGVYPYTVHHRLLDLISAASGLSPSAGRLVNVLHRDDPKAAHPVVLDPSGTETGSDRNPELLPGDTVQVSRAGLVYVIGDVVRPGGFPVDPAQQLTVVQALSLAWGPGQNAASAKALLIREQKGGRTLTALNLKRMIRGLEPDQAVHDRDILYVPDSTAKNLWNRTLESAIQSAVGVAIYGGLVYSQRF
jgi:polysaccharide export outer membrane protein